MQHYESTACFVVKLVYLTCSSIISIDGVASQAFNGLTAMYYLLEQKQHARRLKKAESSKTQIRQNSSNLSKPETGSDTNESSKPRDVAAPLPISAAQHSAPQPHHQHQQSAGPGHKATAPLKLMSIEPLAPISSHVERVVKEEKNVPIRTFVPVTPYLQTPLILQQQNQRQQQQQQQHNNMPSLDAYLRGGMELPVEVPQGAPGPAVSHPDASNRSAVSQPTKPNAGSVLVPPLNLRPHKNNASNSTSAAVAVATGSSLLGNKPVLSSQTARGPAPSAAARTGDENTFGHPYTARVPLPSDIAAEIPERPNTRRSHLRSRGGEPHAELAPAEVVSPGEGLDSMPPTRETAPQMAVRRPDGASSGKNAAASAGEAPVAAMSLLVISQKKSLSDHAPPAAQAAVTPVAPEAPKSSAASSSGGAFAGRRGKNIAVPTAPSSDPVAPGSVADTSVPGPAAPSTVHVVASVAQPPLQAAGGRPRPHALSPPANAGQAPLAPIQLTPMPTAPQ